MLHFKKVSYFRAPESTTSKKKAAPAETPILVSFHLFDHIEDTRFTLTCPRLRDVFAQIPLVVADLQNKHDSPQISNPEEKALISFRIKLLNEATRKAETGIVFDVLDSIQLIILIRAYYMHLRASTISALKGQFTPDQIAKFTHSLSANDTRLKETLLGLFTELHTLFSPFSGKAPPENPEEQASYFEHFHCFNKLTQSLAKEMAELTNVLSTPAILPMQSVQLTQLKNLLETQLIRFKEIHFDYGLDCLECDVENEKAQRFFKKFSHACSTSLHGEDKTFETTLGELNAYCLAMNNSLEKFDDPLVRSQLQAVLRLINKLTLEEQEKENPNTTLTDTFSQLRHEVKTTRHKQNAQQEQRKSEVQAQRAQRYLDWLKDFRTREHNAATEITSLLDRLKKEPPQTLEEVEEFKTCIDSIEIPSDPKKQKKPDKALTALVNTIRNTLDSHRSTLEAKRQTLNAQERSEQKVISVFGKHPLERSTLLRSHLLPHITTPAFQDLFNEMYRDTSRICDGGTASILMAEARLNVFCSPKSHIYKAQYLLAQLEDLRHEGTLTSIESKLADCFSHDLTEAIEAFKTSQRHQSADTAPEFISLHDCAARLAALKQPHL